MCATISNPQTSPEVEWNVGAHLRNPTTPGLSAVAIWLTAPRHIRVIAGQMHRLARR